MSPRRRGWEEYCSWGCPPAITGGDLPRVWVTPADGLAATKARVRGGDPALAALGRHVGVDPWGLTADDGRGIRKARAFLTPNVEPGRRWPHPQITPRKSSSLLGLLPAAASGWRLRRLLAAHRQVT